MAGWKKLARTIPDIQAREDALNALAQQRPHIDGAALFSILASQRNLVLLRLLVAYEVIWDFLDNANERTAEAGVANGLQLHRALVEALDVERPISDYYEYVPEYDDGGYLRALVTACRGHCVNLLSYTRVREPLVREALRGLVCALNHDLNPCRRDARLRAWAKNESSGAGEALWFELTGAASTNLTVFALLALASEPTCNESEITRTACSYFPWISVLTAMLDSYVDRADDAVSGNHSYVAHYGSPEMAARRLCLLIRRCLQEASSLESAERHMVIAGCMFAMYLSRDSALTPEMRKTTSLLIKSGGSLTRLLHPILRLWRTAYKLRGA